jgi:enamine deaminase RidA (YjgF/YER057c/UK114 family)
VVQGDWCFVSGTTGFNYQTMTISDDVAEQADQTWKNIESALKQAGFELKHIVRANYVVPNGADFEKTWPVLQKYMGDVRPASMNYIAGLLDPRMKIEIEVTAYKG